MTFGKKLKALRGQVTQKALAESLEMDAGYLSRIENDVPDHLPNVKTIQRIVEALKVKKADADYLFVLAGKFPPDVSKKLLKKRALFEVIRKA